MAINFLNIHQASNTDEERNYEQRSVNAVIDTLVIHNMDLTGEESFKILTTPRYVSAHYLIREDGSIDKIVDESLKAWHAGVSYWRGNNFLNDRSIGIEIAAPGIDINRPKFDNNNNYTGKAYFNDAQINSLIALIEDIRSLNPDISDLNIIGHNDIAPGRKFDPGPTAPWKILAEHDIGIVSYIEKPKNNMVICKFGDCNEEVKKAQEALDKIGYKIDINSEYDQQTSDAILAFKIHHCQQQIDDIWDDYACIVATDIINKYDQYEYDHMSYWEWLTA